MTERIPDGFVSLPAPLLPPLLMTIPILSSKANGFDLYLLAPAAATEDKMFALSLIFDIAILGTLLLLTMMGSGALGVTIDGFAASILCTGAQVNECVHE